MNCKQHLLYLCITALILLARPDACSQVFHVKQDGTGDFTQIQPAVDAAGNGDTILVWPGEYVENVIIQDKHLVMASLYLTTGDESYIDSTIINGNQGGSCIAVLEGSDTTSLVGFTITNGSGYPVYPDYYCGGGIIVYYSSARISHCEIHNNQAHDGGGGLCLWGSQVLVEDCNILDNFTPHAAGGVSCIFDSYVHFKGTDIKNNHAYYNAGGILVVGSETVFDSVNRCNIYLNFSGAGCDISIHNSSILNTIFADTLTVPNPGHFFISLYDDYGYPLNGIEIEAFASKITPYDGDLHVNPVSGSDDNAGTHPDSALKTIAFAYAKIKVDSMDKNTIHLAEGIYSDSANSEKFPLNIRPFINVKGAGRDLTILDGMFKSYLVHGNTTVSDYTYSNLTMQRGTMVDYDNTFNNTDLFGFIYYENNNIVFDSIRFRDGIGEPGEAALQIQGCNNVVVSNCIFEDVKGLVVLDVSLFNGDTASINNCIFDHNKPDQNNPEWHYGKALTVHGGYDEDDPFVAVIQNCLFNNNDENAFLATMGKAYLVNNTFVNNSLESFGLSAVNIWGTRGYMYNCISYNNGDSPFMVWELDEVASDFNVYHSCIEGGEASFHIDQVSTLYYDETNIDTEPLFSGEPDHPYNLGSASPCIDAGTLDIPEWIELYPYDLAGNPRVYNDSVDMGAYEWNPTVSVKEPPLITTKQKLLSAAPNPFSDVTTITMDLKVQANTCLDIYDSRGTHFRHFNALIQSDGTTLQWDGKDKSNRECPPGLYVIVLSVENRVLDELKVLKVE